ncbi:hypothetical protein QN362_08440 [Actimicrobium sp. CCC2.4]|uniref:hypothetical protein n=1 Tax=Actimicrobium sp. CCC2.4 TaxID=3048606 RepID=UPI002AC9302B|nr:hypothetical protein [Actimicrobium sp. CCC2.4]MEB0135360.1 hypothetical protein [Actimicrobium sp. CCC2.4]WPX32464.1 hypothetical protein RHM62_01045 [Actimicrobium sp. CCC2.4]
MTGNAVFYALKKIKSAIFGSSKSSDKDTTVERTSTSRVIADLQGTSRSLARRSGMATQKTLLKTLEASIPVASPSSPVSKKQPENCAELVSQYSAEFKNKLDGATVINNQSNEDLKSAVNDILLLDAFFECKSESHYKYTCPSLEDPEFFLGDFQKWKRDNLGEKKTSLLM